MNSKLDSQIADWKTQVWQNQGIAQRYQVNIYLDSFVTTLKNVREIALSTQLSRGQVLDAGAGTGRFTIPLFDAGFDVTGLDVSAEMLGVARQAAGDRPIPLVQGSVFDLPYGPGSFDTVVSITVVPHFPQWADILREYARVLRPGGRMIFNMCSLPNVMFANRDGLRHGAMAHPGDPNYYQAEISPEEVIATLAELGATVTHLIPYDVFNHNYALREALGPRNEAAMAELEHAFREPGALELWDYIECMLFPHMPFVASYGYMVVAELDGPDGKPTPWAPPAALPQDASLLDAAALKAAMGEGYEAFKAGLRSYLQPTGAVRLVAAFNDLIGPYLPLPVDFLSMLDPTDQARVLDQIAWRWACGWHGGAQAFSHRGTDLAPLMEYEAFNQLAKSLKPLLGGVE